jgi:membrane protease YdiL (CAAX protease family)
MLIVLAIVIGATLGAAAHFALPQRGLRGVAVGPLLGTALAALAWMILTWAGQGPDSLWTWLATIAAPAVLVPVALRTLSGRRASDDANERAALGIS